MAMKQKVKRSVVSDVPTIEEAFRMFCEEKEASNLSAATMRDYKQSFKYWYEFCGFTDESTMEEVNLQQLFAWIGTLKNNDVKFSSINHYLRDVRTFLYWAMAEERGYIPKQFKVKLLSGQEVAPKHFQDDDIQKLLEKPKRRASFVEWRTWAVINWVLGTGNRQATVCEVKIGDIDFKRKEIYLRHTKNKKLSTLPLSTSTASALKEYIRLWRKDCDDTDYLFPNIGDEKMTTGSLRKAFANYCKDREVYQTNFHGLRHTFARLYIKNGGDLFRLQTILGHQTLEMTRRYVAVYAEDLKEDYDDFAPLDVIKKKQSRTQKVKRTLDDE